MGLFFNIPKKTSPKMMSRIFFSLILALSPLHTGLLANPVGSHVDSSAQFANARHLWQSGKLKQAAALYESLIDRYPDLPDPYNNLAVIYAAQGDYKKAQQILEKGLNTHPGYAAIYENLTAIYVEMARDSYGKALQFSDKSQRQLKLRALAELSVKPIQIAEAEVPVVSPVPELKAITETNTEIAEGVPVSADTEESPVLTASTSVQPAVANPVMVTVDPTVIQQTLEAWASAWSTQSAEQYFLYYDVAYRPPGMSRKRWETQRVDRIKKPEWIRVSLGDYSIEPIEEKRVRVEVEQRYQSNSYSDKGRKEFILIETEQGWRIISERNI